MWVGNFHHVKEEFCPILRLFDDNGDLLDLLTEVVVQIMQHHIHIRPDLKCLPLDEAQDVSESEG